MMQATRRHDIEEVTPAHHIAHTMPPYSYVAAPRRELAAPAYAHRYDRLFSYTLPPLPPARRLPAAIVFMMPCAYVAHVCNERCH